MPQGSWGDFRTTEARTPIPPARGGATCFFAGLRFSRRASAQDRQLRRGERAAAGVRVDHRAGGSG
jgi:hypothetical protein